MTHPETEPDDQTILRMLRAGEAEGVRALLLVHGGEVRRALLRRFEPELDGAVIDAVIAAAARSAPSAVASFDGGHASVRAWFYTEAVRTAAERLRRRGGADAVDLRTPGSTQAETELMAAAGVALTVEAVDALLRTVDPAGAAAPGPIPGGQAGGPGATHLGFADTHWSLIGELGVDDAARHEAAMAALVQMYVGPVYAYFRKLGSDREHAAELTQAFFARKVVERKLFERADRSRARLRTLLRRALVNFRIDDHKHEAARGGRIKMSLEQLEREEHVLPREVALSPEDAFQRRWASAVLEEAMRRCRRYYFDRNREQVWEAFYVRTVRPIKSGTKPPSQTSVAEEVGMKAAGDVALAVFDVRRRLQVFMREVITETVADPEQADEEYQELVKMLRRG